MILNMAFGSSIVLFVYRKFDCLFIIVTTKRFETNCIQQVSLGLKRYDGY